MAYQRNLGLLYRNSALSLSPSLFLREPVTDNMKDFVLLLLLSFVITDAQMSNGAETISQLVLDLLEEDGNELGVVSDSPEVGAVVGRLAEKGSNLMRARSSETPHSFRGSRHKL